MATDTRRALGAHGERAAVRHLEAAGYGIADRNYRTRHGELDIVAFDARCLVFCEVKTRVASGSGAAVSPLESIGHEKRRRLRRMAREWLADGVGDPARPRRVNIRFDAIGVTVTARGELVRLDHVEGAF